MTATEETAAAIAAERIANAPFRGHGDVAVDMEAAYAIQDATTPLLAAAQGGLAGWKIAWNSAAMQAKFGVDQPHAARVFARDVRRGPAKLALADYRTFNIEPEITAILKAPLAGGGHDARSVAPAVARLVPSFELLDRREMSPCPAPEIVANGIFNCGAVLGGPGAAPDEIDFDRLETVLERDGAEILRAAPGWPQHPLEALAFIANLFNGRGFTLEAGEFVLLGSHTPLIPIEAPTTMRMALSGLGDVSFEAS